MSNDTAAEGKKSPPPTHALIIELEYVATRLRAVQFEAIKHALKPKGVELTPVLFARSGMAPLHRVAITQVLERLGKKSDAIEKAVAEVDKAVCQFCENGAVLAEGLEKLVKAAQARGVPVLAISALPAETARKLMARLGLAAMGVELVLPDEVKESFPRADDWLKMLKHAGKESATLVAVVSSQIACKGALTAGAACIAVPDELTVFQDFGGAKLVLESLAGADPGEMLDLTLRM